MLLAGAQATGGPCIRGFEHGSGSGPACLADGAARCAEPFPATMIPFRRRSGRNDLANRSACPPVASRATLTPGYPSAYRCALRTLPGPRGSTSIGEPTGPSPNFHREYRTNPKVAEILTIATRQGVRPRARCAHRATQSRPAHPSGLRRHEYPRSHGPAERKVKGQWLTLGCCADPGPNGTRPAERTDLEGKCRMNPKGAEILASRVRTCFLGTTYMPDAALSPILFDHVRRLLGDHLVRPAQIHLDRATAPPEPRPRSKCRMNPKAAGILAISNTEGMRARPAIRDQLCSRRLRPPTARPLEAAPARIPTVPWTTRTKG